MNILAETDELAIEGEQIKGFSRTLAEIEWLLIALVIFYMQISGLTFEDKPEIILILVLFVVFVLSFHCYGLHKIHRKWKIAIETWAMIAFITLIIWCLGEIESSLFSLYSCNYRRCYYTGEDYHPSGSGAYFGLLSFFIFLPFAGRFSLPGTGEPFPDSAFSLLARCLFSGNALKGL